MSSTNTSFVPAFATTLARKMAEAQGGGYCLNPQEKSAIADEFGRMPQTLYMAMWEAIPVTSVDRQRLMGLLCSSCTPDVAANIMQEWVMEDAIAIASARLERMDAARIAASENMLADAARKSNLAEAALTEARQERAEARELLTMANKLRDAAADADEIAFLRRQLQEANSRLDAISMALAR